MKDKTLQKIKSLGLLSVIRAPDSAAAVKIADALTAGGITGIEITYTTPGALEAVTELADKYGSDIVLGMGTLTRPDQAGAAREAGAQFLVSPHTEENLAGAMRETGLPVMMGALTPSEIMRAQQLGSDVVKVFPGSLFGPAYFRALRGPYPTVKLMPTGGVDLHNLDEWFAAGAFAVGVGSALLQKDWILKGRYQRITEAANRFHQQLQLVR
ncbi:MAG: bifunctional 4-hydroxy-2-oxoglutarate aldolase/2-dehydro-3-deoxy-phosphogluconate aldolase [Anaerolineales bacterium]|nr:bifunctional 4-hydroxy-2-oxoglutarate aldolase/2-dehydro-3-deoxy-phosphogluconate aldolase [Anaerolineales bacterium]